MSVPTNSSLSPFSSSHLTSHFLACNGSEFRERTNTYENPLVYDSKMSRCLELTSMSINQNKHQNSNAKLFAEKSVLSPGHPSKNLAQTELRKERKGITGLTDSKQINTSTKPSAKILSPQQQLAQSKGLSAKASEGRAKSSEMLFDRYIPCRVTQNLQAKFDAVLCQSEERAVGVLLDAEEDVN